MRRIFFPLMAVAMAAPATAQAAEYSVFIYETPAQLALRTAQDEAGKAYWGAFAAYAAEMTKAGVLRGGAALVTAPEAKNQPTGYFIIDVATPAEADAWASKAPSVSHGGSASARAHLPMMGK